MFKTNTVPNTDGFTITFANGYTISVQWSNNHYCHKNEKLGQTAEVAAWDANNNWYDLQEDDAVIGWQTPDQVAALIQKINSL